MLTLEKPQSRDSSNSRQENPRPARKKPARRLAEVAGCLLATILLLLLLEGLASYTYFGRELFSRTSPIVGGYTQFDSYLGWAAIPNVYIENQFGPGVYFRSNSQGFRNDEDFSREIPGGKFRIVCSGDSFTMGFGVSNDRAWCSQLTRMDDRIQAVNMGQAAYGIDQAYLWYERDGSKLDLDLHILAFINDDFARMTFASHWGYGKPILTIENGELAIKNVPVPHYNRLIPPLMDKMSSLNDLRTFKALSHVFHRVVPESGEKDYWKRQLESLPVAFKIFQTLWQTHAQEKRLFVTVYLPSMADCFGDVPNDDKLRQALDAESRKTGLWFWDLTADCQQLPARTVRNMFFSAGELASYHLTDEGNLIIAGLLYRKMMETAEIAARLQRTDTKE